MGANLTNGARFAGPAALVEGGGGGLEDAVGVLQQLLGVPAEEEMAVLGVPAAALAHKEARLPCRTVVVAAVVWPVVAPAHPTRGLLKNARISWHHPPKMVKMVSFI